MKIKPIDPIYEIRDRKPREILLMKKKQPSDIDKKTGVLIREHRLLRGVTLETLAESLEVTPQQISKYEKGFNRVTLGRLHEIAKALNCDVYNLIPKIDLEG